MKDGEIFLGTVTSLTPLLVTMDGAATGVKAWSDNVLLGIGDRVSCVYVRREVYVVGHKQQPQQSGTIAPQWLTAAFTMTNSGTAYAAGSILVPTLTCAATLDVEVVITPPTGTTAGANYGLLLGSGDGRAKISTTFRTPALTAAAAAQTFHYRVPFIAGAAATTTWTLSFTASGAVGRVAVWMT